MYVSAIGGQRNTGPANVPDASRDASWVFDGCGDATWTFGSDRRRSRVPFGLGFSCRSNIVTKAALAETPMQLCVFWAGTRLGHRIFLQEETERTERGFLTTRTPRSRRGLATQGASRRRGYGVAGPRHKKRPWSTDDQFPYVLSLLWPNLPSLLCDRRVRLRALRQKRRERIRALERNSECVLAAAAKRGDRHQRRTEQGRGRSAIGYMPKHELILA